MDHEASAEQLSAEGVRLFKEERYDAALERFSEALAKVGVHGPFETRARLLNNRASTLLRLGRPLDSLSDSAEAVEAACEPSRLARGHMHPRSAGLRSVLVKTLSVRAKAFQAAGNPQSALPLATTAVHYGAVGEMQETVLRLRSPDAGPAVAPGVTAGRCERLAIDTTRTPPARNYCAYACVGWKLFLLGGWCVALHRPDGNCAAQTHADAFFSKR